MREDPAEPLQAGEPAAVEWLRACGRLGDPGFAGELARAVDPPPGRGDVWIARRSEPDAFDAAFVLRLASGGGAVVWEPGEEIRPELALWVRPTLVDGAASELIVLASGWARAAPRWRRERWLRRRLARLRALLVTEGDAEKVASAIATKIPSCGARVLPFPRGRW